MHTSYYRLCIPGLNLTGTKYVDQGKAIRLVCHVTGAIRAPDGIDWFKDGESIETSNHRWSDRTVILKETMGRTFRSELIIKQSVIEDAGIYICRGSDLSVNSLRVDVLSSK